MEETYVSPRGNEVTVSDPAGVVNLISAGYRLKTEEPTEEPAPVEPEPSEAPQPKTAKPDPRESGR